MTRAEAIELRMGNFTGNKEWQKQQADRDVDFYVSAGMLKLDEPKNAAAAIIGAKFRQLPSLYGYDGDYLGRVAIEALRDAGIWLVEK